MLCDGLGCDGFAWIYLHSALAKHHQVIHWHYRGHGRSELPRDPSRLKVEDVAQDLVCILDASDIERACICGHSFGVQVALETYRRASHRVSGLALVCGSYGYLTSTFHGSDWLERSLPLIIRTVSQHPVAAKTLWRRFPAGLAYRLAKAVNEIDGHSLKQRDFLYYVDHFTAIDPQMWLRMLKYAGAHSARDVLLKVQVPSLVLAAERDTFTPPWLAKEMAQLIDGAKHVVIEGGSHAAPVEQPSLVLRHLEELMESIDANPAVGDAPEARNASQTDTEASRPR